MCDHSQDYEALLCAELGSDLTPRFSAAYRAETAASPLLCAAEASTHRRDPEQGTVLPTLGSCLEARVWPREGLEGGGVEDRHKRSPVEQRLLISEPVP